MDEEDEDSSPLQDATSQMHELFLSYCESGFTIQQSLYIVASIASGGPKAIPE